MDECEEYERGGEELFSKRGCSKTKLKSPPPADSHPLLERFPCFQLMLKQLKLENRIKKDNQEYFIKLQILHLFSKMIIILLQHWANTLGNFVPWRQQMTPYCLTYKHIFLLLRIQESVPNFQKWSSIKTMQNVCINQSLLYI